MSGVVAALALAARSRGYRHDDLGGRVFEIHCHQPAKSDGSRASAFKFELVKDSAQRFFVGRRDGHAVERSGAPTGRTGAKVRAESVATIANARVRRQRRSTFRAEQGTFFSTA